uniref:Uncharacterized protein n=1 Tax=Anguilla anguilla TaxID=7936 RepID=A0A0E9USX2_ANGAN
MSWEGFHISLSHYSINTSIFQRKYF